MVQEAGNSSADLKYRNTGNPFGNHLKNAVLLKPKTPEMLLEEKQLQEQVYSAVMNLPEKQAKRIYARYYLGMTVNEIAGVEGVDPSRVRDSIRRGLKQLGKYF